MIRDLFDRIKLLRRNLKMLGIDYFIIWYRYNIQIYGVPLKSKKIGPFLIYLFILIIIIWGIVSGYSFEWTGFGNFVTPGGGFHSAKTFWDWMELFLVPLILGAVAYFFTRSERNAEKALTLEKMREGALQDYLNNIERNLQEHDTKQPEKNKSAVIARARTISLLRGLDNGRKGILLRFLFEAGLIAKNNPFIDLSIADFSGIAYHHSPLYEACLHEVNFDNAFLEHSSIYSSELSGSSLMNAKLQSADLRLSILEYAYLNHADFYNAKLSGAGFGKASLERVNFAMSDLENANLRGTNLRNANLRKANLTGASFDRADLINANLRQANLRNATLIDANLAGANLSGADLSGADFTNSIISIRQLKQAKSLNGTILTGIKERIGPPQDY